MFETFPKGAKIYTSLTPSAHARTAIPHTTLLGNLLKHRRDLPCPWRQPYGPCAAPLQRRYSNLQGGIWKGGGENICIHSKMTSAKNICTHSKMTSAKTFAYTLTWHLLRTFAYILKWHLLGCSTPNAIFNENNLLVCSNNLLVCSNKYGTWEIPRGRLEAVTDETANSMSAYYLKRHQIDKEYIYIYISDRKAYSNAFTYSFTDAYDILAYWLQCVNNFDV